jgi:hypothetical protein
MTANTGTVSVKLSDTASTGSWSSGTYINTKVWQLQLPGEAALTVQLTFQIPAGCQSFGGRAVAAKSTSALTVLGANHTDEATSRSRGVTIPANGAAVVNFATIGGDSNTIATFTGLGTVSPGTASGSRINKDLSIRGGHEASAAGGARTAAITTTVAKQAAWTTSVFDPVSGSSSTVTLKGDTSIPAGKRAEILCHSDGDVFYIRVV